MAADDPAASDPLASLPILPLTFSDDLTLPDDFQFFDDEGFDITFDDFTLPSDTELFLNSTVNTSGFLNLSSSDPEFNGFVSDHEAVVDGNYGSDVSGFLNIPSPDDDSGTGFVDETVNLKSVTRVLENSSPELRHENPVSSQGSGNCGSAGSEAAMSCPSPESGNSVVNQKVKRETPSNNHNNSNDDDDDDDDNKVKNKNNNNNTVLKRKNEIYDANSESRINKYRKSNETSTMTDDDSTPVNEKDEKKRARLIRNRESAQLSRQRKKHYVEELEDKVRAMHATIQDLNARITYFAAENANLKQQMVGGGGGVCSAPVMYPPHPAMAPIGYPWMPCPPYVVKPQGSQVPLVPIPRLKPQQPASSQKSKKIEVKKAVEGASKSKTKTKKVAGISFIGLLLFIFLFGGLVPLMNVKLGGVVTDGVYSGNKSNEFKLYNHGRVLMGDEYDHHLNRTNGNASEPLVASLYVPRNDKLVKIDGNLIIHSVLASEKAMATRDEQEERIDNIDDAGLTVSSDLVPAISIPAVNRNMYRTSSDHQRALSSDKENLKSKSKHADGKLQQWFREGLAGPMLSSGMCTEVFQFDVSAAIVPATSAVNITATDNHHNSTYIPTMKNRRILRGLPIPLTATNITKEKVAAAAEPGGHDSDHHEPHYKNNSASSMVVSVLFDPREAGDGGDVEGMMGGGAKGKSFSRIFVVVLLDSVKYVTYSCMLPLKGASHLVTA